MKKLFKILPLFLLLVITMSALFIINAEGIETAFPTGGTEIGEITSVANTVWATVISIVQILAFAAIVFAGLRYMFASANGKADIKKETTVLIAGAALVFASPAIVGFIKDITESVLA